MNKALKTYTDYKETDLEEIGKSVTIVKDTIEVLNAMFKPFNREAFFNGTPLEQLECLNHAVEFVQFSKEMEDRFMALVKRLKDAYNLCSGGDELTDKERNLIHFYLAVRSILYKLTKGDAPDAEQMNRRVSKMIEEAIQSEGVTELFTIGKDTKRIEEDIFSDEYYSTTSFDFHSLTGSIFPNVKSIISKTLSILYNEQGNSGVNLSYSCFEKAKNILSFLGDNSINITIEQLKEIGKEVEVSTIILQKKYNWSYSEARNVYDYLKLVNYLIG